MGHYLKILIEFLKHPKELFIYLARKDCFKWMPDEIYLKIIYYCKTGKRLNLKDPKSYNQKLQWIKLYDRRSEYTTYVDKLKVREYIKEKIGQEYLIPLIEEYDSIEEIKWEELPNKFVLKCTHNSGGNIICTNKEELDIEKTKKKLKKWMKRNWFWHGREWAYKDVIPKIICEQYMSNSDGTLNDYKILCFNGKAKYIQVHRDRYINHTQTFYDLKGNRLPFHHKAYKQSSIKKIDVNKLQDIIRLAETLSRGYYQMRVDFYLVEGRPFFGEITLYNFNGFVEMEPDQYNEILGEDIKLNLDKKRSGGIQVGIGN